MLILVGCEESQAVCIELRKLGHEAYSCDKKPCSGGHPEWHLQMDIFEALLLRDWDAAILFPDCTFICTSGLHWNKRIPGRAQQTEDALNFVCRLLNMCKRLGIKKVSIENPVGCISTRIICDTNGNYLVLPHNTKRGFKPTQTIQPYNFGEDASKRTCLWLIGLPPLKNTEYFPPRVVGGGVAQVGQSNGFRTKQIMDFRGQGIKAVENLSRHRAGNVGAMVRASIN